MASYEVPNLPVFKSNRQRARPKPQTFSITRDGVPTEKRPKGAPAMAPPADDAADRFTSTAMLAMTGTRDTGLLASSTRRAAASMGATRPPAFVELDRQVLRFFSYFKEAVHESAVEAARVRKCTIQYFLVDGSAMIIEHREENSGIPQGTFVKRHQIPKPTGGVYEPQDFIVGGEITVYGRTLRIVDADPFTRAFYQDNMGYDQGPAEAYPGDSYATMRTTMVAGADGSGFGTKSNPLKKFMEASLGKVAAGRGEEVDLEKFLKNDRKVLRFHCTWDDTGRLYGDKIAYTLHYFLADDTVEVREVPVMNSGRDNFPMLLRKQKLPKDWKINLHNDAARGVEDNPPPETYVQPQDLRVGGSVNVFGRDLKIQGCDAFTQKWYRTNLGYAQPAAVRTESKAEDESKSVPIPPYTGFGEEADSLASFYSLVPKPPKKDFNKFMKNDRKVLRFSARLARACPEDRHRSFIIQLYLADDTLAIYEPSIRNSGIVGGQFLVRNKYKKADGEVYNVRDFVPGEEVTIYKRRFLVVDADEFTKHMYPALLPGDADATPAADNPRAKPVLVKVRDALRRRGIHGIHGISRKFRRIDTEGAPGLSLDELKEGFAGANIKLTDDEVNDLYDAFDHNDDGRISFNEFLGALRGPMNHRRLALCHAAFDLLDSDGAGEVSLDSVVKKYDFSQNEKVLSGEQSVWEAAEDFVAQWDTLKKDGIITRAEFIEYVKGVSASIDSDDYFQLVMKKAWRI